MPQSSPKSTIKCSHPGARPRPDWRGYVAGLPLCCQPGPVHRRKLSQRHRNRILAGTFQDPAPVLGAGVTAPSAHPWNVSSAHRPYEFGTGGSLRDRSNCPGACPPCRLGRRSSRIGLPTLDTVIASGWTAGLANGFVATYVFRCPGVPVRAGAVKTRRAPDRTWQKWTGESGPGPGGGQFINCTNSRLPR